MATQIKTRNHSIDIFRFIFATTAILNHCHALWDISETAYYYWAEYVPRITVLYFLCVAGYYYSKSLFAGKLNYFHQLANMLKIYLLWTTVYYICSFIINVLINKEPLSKFLVERVIFFFTRGSYPHMWYFPAMIYGMTAFTIVHKLFKQKGLLAYSTLCVLLYIIGALGSAYLEWSNNLPFAAVLYSQSWFPTLRGIISMGLPCFASGYWVFCLEKRLAAQPDKCISVIFATITVIVYAELSFLILVKNWIETPFMVFSFMPFAMTLLLYLLRNPMPKLEKISWYARRQSIAIFCVHPLILIAIKTASELSGLEIADTPLFLVIYTLSLIFGFIVIRLNGRMGRLLLGL